MSIFSGIALINDWLGDSGMPVAPMVANFRAQRCLHGNNGEACPNNVEPNWWDRIKSKIAETIRMQLEIKHKLNLTVDEEDKLHMCAGCGCALRLKVWAPIEHIKNHTDQKTLDKMPAEYCWIRKELHH